MGTYKLLTQTVMHLRGGFDFLLLLLCELREDLVLAEQRILLSHRGEVTIVGFRFL